MTKFKKLILTFAVSIIGILVLGMAVLFLFGKGKLMLPVSQKDAFVPNEGAKFAQALFAEDTMIRNESGEQVILKGLMVPEIKELDIEGKFNKEYFEEIFECGGNVIRIPIHPDRYAEDKYYLWRYLDPIVSWAMEYDKYVIMDLHFIGNIATNAGDEMRDVGMSPYAFSIEFWDTLASYFKNVPNVIFEIYNEPALIDGAEWAKCAKDLVDTIRKAGANQLVLVSGVDYSYDLSYWAENPLKAANIAYTAHVFPNRDNAVQELEKIVHSLPLVVTEWGFIAEKELAKQNYLLGDRESYGKPLLQFMEKNQTGWVACWYDDQWEPPMFYENREKKTDWGDFVMDNLK